MIVMWHRFEFVKDGVKREITSEIALEGTDQTYTAMSDTVGLPMALAAEHILVGPDLDVLELRFQLHQNIMSQCFPSSKS